MNSFTRLLLRTSKFSIKFVIVSLIENGSKVVSVTAWTDRSTISYNISDGLLKGDYNITIIVTDENGNIAHDTVIFTVITTETTTTDDAPGFSLSVAIFVGIFLLIIRKR